MSERHFYNLTPALYRMSLKFQAFIEGYTSDHIPQILKPAMSVHTPA